MAIYNYVEWLHKYYTELIEKRISLLNVNYVMLDDNTPENLHVVNKNIKRYKKQGSEAIKSAKIATAALAVYMEEEQAKELHEYMQDLERRFTEKAGEVSI